MFLCSLIEELCTKEENDKTGCNFNFGHKCILNTIFSLFQFLWFSVALLLYRYDSKFRDNDILAISVILKKIFRHEINFLFRLKNKFWFKLKNIKVEKNNNNKKLCISVCFIKLLIKQMCDLNWKKNKYKKRIASF